MPARPPTAVDASPRPPRPPRPPGTPRSARSPGRRSRAPLWRALASLVVVGLALLAAVSMSPRLGLDLEGGTQIVLETQDSERLKADRASTDRALEVLRGRVDALGVAEPTLARAGERRIIVELPGVQDPREAAQVIGQTAQLGFHQVVGVPQQGADAPPRSRAVQDEDGRPVLIGPPLLDGDGVEGAEAEQPQDSVGQWVVSVAFNRTGAPQWRDLVARACQDATGARRIAIVLDDEVISSPAVQPDLCSGAGAATQITGRFSQEAAGDLAV